MTGEKAVLMPTMTDMELEAMRSGDFAARLNAAVSYAARVAAGKWEPIETAPPEEMVLLAGVMDHNDDWRIKVGYYSTETNAWRVFGASWKPLRWMPLPPPPESAA